MSYIHPAALEGLRKRWERADAYRFAAPGTPEAKMPGTLHPWAAVARAEEAKAAADTKAHAEFVAEVEALRAANERVRIMLADVKFELALRALGRKYSPECRRAIPTAGSGRAGEGAEQEERVAAIPVACGQQTSAHKRGAPDRLGLRHPLAGKPIWTG